MTEAAAFFLFNSSTAKNDKAKALIDLAAEVERSVSSDFSVLNSCSIATSAFQIFTRPLSHR
jgi:hypothetical protein